MSLDLRAKLRWAPHVPQNYQEQTHASPYRIIRFPHLKRYECAVEELVRLAPKRVLDYGTGDGFFIEQLYDRLGPAMPTVVAYEPVVDFETALVQIVERVSPRRVTLVRNFDGLREVARVDVITCLGVLEHLPLPERQKFYEVCESHLLPHGHCLIDVPIEIGPSLLVKATARRLLKGREAEYRLRDLVRLFAGACEFDARRFDPANDEPYIWRHTGFDYRILAKELERRFRIVRRFATPFPRLPPALGNQEIFFLLERRT